MSGSSALWYICNVPIYSFCWLIYIKWFAGEGEAMYDRGGRNRFPGAGAARFCPTNPWQTEVSTNVTAERTSLMFFSVFYIFFSLFSKSALCSTKSGENHLVCMKQPLIEFSRMPEEDVSLSKSKLWNQTWSNQMSK